MAKSNSFFGLRKGSTKTLTFQVLNGKQITKDRVYTTTNPKTYNQMTQRACFATVAAAYRTLAEICDHSFEGVEGKVLNQAEFVKRNIEIMRNRSSCFNPKGWKWMLPNPLVVSDGTLSLVGQVNDSGASSFVDLKDGRRFDLSAIDGWGSIKDEGQVWMESFTWQDFADITGMKMGEQLTLMQVSMTDDDFVDAYNAASTALRLCRIVLPDTAEGMAKLMFSQVSGESDFYTIANANSNSQNLENLIFSWDKLALGIRVPSSYGASISGNYGAAIIRSSYANGKWKRSKAFLHGDWRALADPTALSMAKVVETWNPNSEMYLNNAATRSMPTSWTK